MDAPQRTHLFILGQIGAAVDNRLAFVFDNECDGHLVGGHHVGRILTGKVLRLQQVVGIAAAEQAVLVSVVGLCGKLCVGLLAPLPTAHICCCDDQHLWSSHIYKFKWILVFSLLQLPASLYNKFFSQIIVAKTMHVSNTFAHQFIGL